MDRFESPDGDLDHFQRERSPKRQRTPNGYIESPGYSSAEERGPQREQEGVQYQLAERPARGSVDGYDYNARFDEGNTSEQHPRFYEGRPSRSSSPPQSRTPPGVKLEADEVLPLRESPPLEKPTQLHYKPKLILRGHKRGVSQVKFSPDGRRIASCSADATIKIWDAFTGKHHHTLEGHLAGVSTIAWSPDSKILASGSDDKSIRLWDTKTGKAHPNPLLGHHNYIYSLAFSPKGNMLVSGSYDEAVFLWDVRTARVMRSLPAHSDPVSGVDFVRDGTLLVSCAEDGLIRIWDTATGQCLRTLVDSDNSPVTAVRFSPNGRFVLAWTLDSCIRLWDFVDGRCVKTYQGHRNEKYSLCGAFGVYCSDGGAGGGDAGEDGDDGGGGVEVSERRERSGEKYAFIVSGSEDGALVFWDVSSKNVLQKVEGHDGAVLGVDTHPTELMVVSCGLDKTVKVWEYASSFAGNGGMEQ